MILCSSKESKSLIWGKGTFKERRKSVSLKLDIATYIIPVFLMAKIEVIRQVFFDRSDKKEMLDCLKKLDNSMKLIENMFKALEYTLDDDMKDVQKSGFKYFIRELNPDWEGIIHDIEKHFSFITL